MDRYDIQLAVASEIGLCKNENQDRLMARVGEGPTGDFGLFAIADGMGSQRGGGESAETAIMVLDDWWNTVLPRIMDADSQASVIRAVQSLEMAAYHINEAVLSLGAKFNSKPGTTLSILFFYGGWYGFAHIGDSRIYKVEYSLEIITPDDTWVANQVRNGSMTPEEAELHPHRHVLTQCAGLGEMIRIHTGMGSIQQGGFILCSDGFYHHLTHREMLALPVGTPTMEIYLRSMVDCIYQRGATDNLSAVVVRI